MRLFGIPNGTIGSDDRSMWLTNPFDGAFFEVETIPVFTSAANQRRTRFETGERPTDSAVNERRTMFITRR